MKEFYDYETGQYGEDYGDELVRSDGSVMIKIDDELAIDVKTHKFHRIRPSGPPEDECEEGDFDDISDGYFDDDFDDMGRKGIFGGYRDADIDDISDEEFGDDFDEDDIDDDFDEDNIDDDCRDEYDGDGDDDTDFDFFDDY